MRPILQITRKADVDLSAATNRGRCVVATAANGMALAVAVSIPIGLLQDTPALGKAGAVCVVGTALGRASGAIAVQTRVRSDANGRLVAAAATEPSVGITLEAAGALDDLIEVLVVPQATA